MYYKVVTKDMKSSVVSTVEVEAWRKVHEMQYKEDKWVNGNKLFAFCGYQGVWEHLNNYCPDGQIWECEVELSADQMIDFVWGIHGQNDEFAFERTELISNRQLGEDDGRIVFCDAIKLTKRIQ